MKVRVKHFDTLPDSWNIKMRDLMGKTIEVEYIEGTSCWADLDYWYFDILYEAPYYGRARRRANGHYWRFKEEHLIFLKEEDDMTEKKTVTVDWSDLTKVIDDLIEIKHKGQQVEKKKPTPIEWKVGDCFKTVFFGTRMIVGEFKKYSVIDSTGCFRGSKSTIKDLMDIYKNEVPQKITKEEFIKG